MAQLAIALPVPAAVAAPERVLLPNPEGRAQAKQRLGILEMILAYRKDPLRFGRLALADGTAVSSVSRMVAYTSETNHISEATIYRWLKEYKRGDLAALSDKTRSDKGQSRFFTSYPKAQLLAAYLYLEEKASARVCWEAIRRDRELLEIPPDKVPSPQTVRAWLNSMPPSLIVYARMGAKVYRERMAPYLKRQFTDVYANQVWVGDHAIHDVECANDCFDGVEVGAPVRIRISAMLDYRSRLVVGATWCWEGSSRAIAACMRRGIVKYGPPEHLYVDNGRDYRKVARGALRSCAAPSPLDPPTWQEAELDRIADTGFLARLGIAVTHCIPHHPQSKCIERFFRTLHERYDKLWPTYTSGTPFTRPESTEDAMMAHRRLLKAGRADESKHPLASVFIVGCLAWIEEYNSTAHDGEGMDGGSPREVFEAHRNPRQKPTPDYATLALLMAERETRPVHKCAVTLKKSRYTPVDAAGWAAMHEFNEREILVVYDPADLNAAAAVDANGHFLAWLEAEELVRFAPWDEKAQARISESMAMRRRLEKGNRQTIELVTRAARSNGALSPLEAMACRLQLSAGETGADLITQRKPHPSPDKNSLAAPSTPAQAARAFMRSQKA